MDKYKEYNEPYEDEEDEELEIDWAELVAKLWQSRKFIIIASLCFGLLGIAVALISKRTYTSTVTLAPESQGGAGGAYSGFASMLGMGNIGGMGNGKDALNMGMFPDISTSTPFLVDMFDVMVTPQKPKGKNKETKAALPKSLTLYKYITKEDEPKGFITNLKESLFGKSEKELSFDTVNISDLTSIQRGVIATLSASITVDTDKKTGITEVGVTMDDPAIAAQLADTVCRRLQEYVIKYRTQKATEDYEYYCKMADDARQKLTEVQQEYAKHVDSDKSVILQKINSERERVMTEVQVAGQIYTQMEQQKAMALAKIQENKPVFVVLEPATVPLYPSSKSRKIIVLGFCFLGIVLSSGWKLFVEDFVKQFYANVKTKINNE